MCVISDFEVAQFLGGAGLMISRNPSECARWLLSLPRRRAQRKARSSPGGGETRERKTERVAAFDRV